jgi:hypothetical protein
MMPHRPGERLQRDAGLVSARRARHKNRITPRHHHPKGAQRAHQSQRAVTGCNGSTYDGLVFTVQ